MSMVRHDLATLHEWSELSTHLLALCFVYHLIYDSRWAVIYVGLRNKRFVEVDGEYLYVHFDDVYVMQSICPLCSDYTLSVTFARLFRICLSWLNFHKQFVARISSLTSHKVFNGRYRFGLTWEIHTKWFWWIEKNYHNGSYLCRRWPYRECIWMSVFVAQFNMITEC